MLPEGALEADAGGERLWLLPERAAYWPRTHTLLVADAHLGKAAAFRNAGVPVPSGTTAENLERLTGLARTLGARRIVFIGDLVHDAAARKAATGAFARWRDRHDGVEIVLVCGNHDRRAGDLAGAWKLDCVEEPYLLDGLALTHHPQPVPGSYAIAGHVHPGVLLAGRGRELLRLPCFYFTAEYAILPAFGAFTGMAEIHACASDRVYAIADTQVIEITG